MMNLLVLAPASYSDAVNDQLFTSAVPPASICPAGDAGTGYSPEQKQAEGVAGSPEARGPSQQEQLLLQHLPQVRQIAKNIRLRFRHADLDDLIGWGTIGLLKAIRAFDTSRGILLKTYAEYRIRGEILDGLRGANWLSRGACRKKVEYQQSLFSDDQPDRGRTPQNDRPPPGCSAPAAAPENETGAQLPTPLLEIHCAGWGLEQLERMSEKSGWRNSESPRQPDPAEIYSRKELVLLVVQAVSRLPRRNREVIEMYYQQDLSLKQIGEVLHVHQSRVSQLHSGAIRHLRNRFAERKPAARERSQPVLDDGAGNSRNMA